MALLEKWREDAYAERSQEEYDAFWNEYFPKEQKNYEQILENKEQVVEGSVGELAERYGMDVLTFTGFLDGINTSLTEQLDLDNLTEESNIKLSIDFQLLYFNMLDAKATWLYSLPQWDDILTVEKRREITKDYNKSRMVINENKVGRNEPCPCGSGKKYKKCCINK
ncbi:SEC-C domain-containing protein [Alkalicella caledoniensis]|uniref:SEC-C domain-containing protein n=1 Tax=Alkalicella caledoniensis TaxID=2731377 RepID=A0A7G9WD77_ALKCA|nr:SEC-C metal-binding domain-containing protein [Alkalicella caledoniensis]QNO16639.1 SEC-C domain-containing protein [Alkalicella caledoniensis]